jgi:hypothetical protein
MTQAPEILKQLQTVLASVSPEQAEQEIARIDGEIRALQEEQNTWRTLHGLTRQLGEMPVNGQPANGGGAVKEIPPLRKAVLSVMTEKPQGLGIRLTELNKDLQERGWLTDSKKDHHRLQMMASTLVKENKLSRPAKGYYELASESEAAQAALPDAPENGNGEPLSMATRSQEGHT